MATLEQRIKALEQQTERNVFHANLRHTYTDEELLDYLGLPHDATEEQLLAIFETNY